MMDKIIELEKQIMDVKITMSARSKFRAIDNKIEAWNLKYRCELSVFYHCRTMNEMLKALSKINGVTFVEYHSDNYLTIDTVRYHVPALLEELKQDIIYLLTYNFRVDVTLKDIKEMGSSSYQHKFLICLK